MIRRFVVSHNLCLKNSNIDRKISDHFYVKKKTYWRIPYCLGNVLKRWKINLTQLNFNRMVFSLTCASLYTRRISYHQVVIRNSVKYSDMYEVHAKILSIVFSMVFRSILKFDSANFWTMEFNLPKLKFLLEPLFFRFGFCSYSKKCIIFRFSYSVHFEKKFGSIPISGSVPGIYFILIQLHRRL